MTTFVEIHALQTVPPSCINRDDSGTPKTAIYGGVQRSRVSSQSWKAAVRRFFRDNTTVELGTRTKELPHMVATKITQIDPSVSLEDAMNKAVQALDATKTKKEQKVVETPTKKQIEKAESEGREIHPTLHSMMLVSQAQVDSLAQLIVDSGDGKPKKADILKVLDAKHSVDLALFGRMVASNKTLSVDGATQFAHAIGVTDCEVEFDFYTAVDDKKAGRDDSDAGSGMMGVKEFTEATLYRYACVDMTSLAENLGDDASAANESVAAFVDAFVRSMPTGSIRSYGNPGLPDTVVVTVRDNQPFNVASAFRTPVSLYDGEIMEVATERMIKRLDMYAAKYDLAPKSQWVLTEDNDTTLSDVVGGLKKALSA